VQDYMEQRGNQPAIFSQPANPSEKQSLSGAFVDSKAVKRAMTEISSYDILLAAAESAGDAETQQVCDTIRRQEEAMVEWLRTYLGAAMETEVARELASSKRRHA
jgi:ferritin-like metal-binding protein YciE